MTMSFKRQMVKQFLVFKDIKPVFLFLSWEEETDFNSCNRMKYKEVCSLCPRRVDSYFSLSYEKEFKKNSFSHLVCS